MTLLPLAGPIERHATLDSTMLRARALLAEQHATLAAGTSVVAAAQTRGRGRHGRTWLSQAQAGLFVTVLVPLPHDAAAEGIALLAGLAALEAVQELLAADARPRVQLKWPNDVVVETRKLAGVLVQLEQTPQGAPWALVGLGLNLAARTTLGEAAQAVHEGRYIGLAELELAAPATLTALGERVLLRFRDRLSEHLAVLWQRGLAPLLPLLIPHHTLLGEQVRATLDGREVRGVARALGERGELLVETPTGLLALVAGEVEKVRPAR